MENTDTANHAVDEYAVEKPMPVGIDVPAHTIGSIDIGDAMVEILTIAKELSTLRSRTNTRMNMQLSQAYSQLSQSQQLSQTDEDVDDEPAVQDRLSRLLDSMNELTLIRLLQHSYTANSKDWNTAENPTVIVLSTILGGSSSRSENSRGNARRATVYKHAVALLNDGNTLGTKASEKAVSVLLSNIDHGAQLMESFPELINGIMSALSIPNNKCVAFELLPAMWGRILNTGAQGNDENQECFAGLAGNAYLDSYVLKRLCQSCWSRKGVVKITQTVRDLPGLTEAQSRRIMKKCCQQLYRMELQELPPLVYQLLLFASKYKKSVGEFWRGLTTFFEDVERRIAEQEAQPERQPTLSQQKKDDHGDAIYIDRGQLRNVQGTVLLHFNYSIQQDQVLGDSLLKSTLTTTAMGMNGASTMSPFTAAIMLSIARIRRFQQPIVSAMFDGIYKRSVLQSLCQVNGWIDSFLTKGGSDEGCLVYGLFEDNESRESLSILHTVVHNGVMGWDHVIPSLLVLSFRLLESGVGKPMLKKSDFSTVQYCTQLGFDLLLNIFQRYTMARVEILEAILTSVGTQGPAMLRYVLLLETLANTNPSLILEHVSIVKLIAENIGRMSRHGARMLVRSITSLVDVRSDLKDFTILILRKAVFNRSVTSRQAAVEGMLQLLCSKPARTMVELSGCLKRALCQEMEVRKVVYDGTISRLQDNTEFSLSVLQLLWRQMKKYLPAESASNSSGGSIISSPLQIDACVNSNGDIIEPVACLLQALTCCTLSVAKAQVGGYGDGIVSRDVYTIIGQLRALCVAFSSEDCEPEDFGLDKNSEFKGVTAGARRNFYCANLLSNCCDVMVAFAGEDAEFPNETTAPSKLGLKHIEGIIRFRGRLMKVAAVALQNNGNASKTVKGADSHPAKRPAMGFDGSMCFLTEPTLASSSSALRLLKRCQAQSVQGSLWFQTLRGSLVNSLLDFADSLAIQIKRTKTTSILSTLSDLTGPECTAWADLVDFCHRIGPVIIQEFEHSRTHENAGSVDGDEASVSGSQVRAKAGKKLANIAIDDIGITALKCLQIFTQVAKILDSLPKSPTTMSRLLKLTFDRSTTGDSMECDGPDGSGESGSQSSMHLSEEGETDDLEYFIAKGTSNLRRLASFSLRDGNVSIALETLETVAILSQKKYTSNYDQAKEWINNLCNAVHVHEKACKNTKLVGVLLKLRECIFAKSSRKTEKPMKFLESTEALSHSILSEAKVFDGAELTQSEGVVSTVKIVKAGPIINIAMKTVMDQVTRSMEDIEWAVSYLKRDIEVNFVSADDALIDPLDEDVGDASHGKSHYQVLLRRRTEWSKSMEFVICLSSRICSSLRPLVNVDVGIILKEKLFRLLIRYFKNLNSLIKLSVNIAKTDSGLFSDFLVKLVRRLISEVSSRKDSLCTEVYTQLPSMQNTAVDEADQDASAKAMTARSKQVIRQSKIIPEMVYAIETFESSLLKLSKLNLNGVTIFNFDHSIARGTARDFRIQVDKTAAGVREGRKRSHEKDTTGVGLKTSSPSAEASRDGEGARKRKRAKKSMSREELTRLEEGHCGGRNENETDGSASSEEEDDDDGARRQTLLVSPSSVNEEDEVDHSDDESTDDKRRTTLLVASASERESSEAESSEGESSDSDGD
jgi:hypothetical protein